jgi:hypothetical protein
VKGLLEQKGRREVTWVSSFREEVAQDEHHNPKWLREFGQVS